MAIVTTSQNLTDVTYSAGEIIEIRNGATLTIDATPATRPGTIQCITSGKLRIENTSTSTPIVVALEDTNRDFRFEGNGVLEVRGAPIVLGTSDGTQQTWDLATLFSGAVTDVTYVDVETASGSGVFMPWPIVDITPQFVRAAFTTAGNTGSVATTIFDAEQEVLFFNSQTRSLTSGDGTNGKLIPTGCQVRIPNILITNQDWQPDVTLIHAIRSLGTPVGGNFTITLINRRTGTTIGTTGNIGHNAAATTVRDAVIAVLGASTVTSSGGPLPTTVVLTLAGAYANLPIAMVVNSSVTGGTNSVIYATENAATNMTLLDLNPSGTLDAEWCAFSSKVRPVNSSFSRATCEHVGFGSDAMQFTNSNGSVALDHVSFRANPATINTTCQVSNVSGATSINKLVMQDTIATGSLIQTLPGLTKCDDLVYLATGARTSTSATQALSLITLPNIQINRPRVIGGSLRLTNLTGNVIVDFTHADTPGVQTTTNPTVACSMVNCIGVTFAGLDNAGTSATRNAVFSTDAACAEILVVGGNYDMNNHGAGVVGQHLGAGFDVRGLTVIGSRTAVQSFDAPTTFACTAMSGRKVFVGGGQAAAPTIDSNQDGVYDLVGAGFDRLISANVSVENYVGGNFMDYGTAPTTGHVTFGPFGSGQGMALTGAAFTDQIGSVFLPANGDVVTITIPFAMHGVTSFQNVSPRFIGDCPGGFANVARVINDGGATGGTFTITAYDSTDTLIGTTSALAFNASTSTVQTAVRLLAGLGSATVSGALATGYIITATGTGVFRFEADGASLTGGTKPGTMDSYARYTVTLDNEVYPGIDFACRVPGTAYPAYQALTGANLSGAIAALTGYDEGGAGLEMRLRVTATGDAEFRRLQQVSLRTNIDPDAWTVFDSSITFNGPNPTDVIRIRRLSDLSANPPVNLYSFTGGGTTELSVGANFGEECFFVREDSTGVVLMRSLPFTKVLGFGDLGDVALFYGAEVQLAQSSEVLSIKAAVDAYLDVAVSTRLATAGYTAPNNAGVTANGVAIAALNDISSAAVQAAAAAAIAAAEPISADVRYVKGIEVVGTGIEADPWGPAP